MKAVEAIRRDGCEVIGMVAAFTYGFPVAIEAFKEAKVNLVTLTNYEAVLDSALKTDILMKRMFRFWIIGERIRLIGRQANKL